PNVNADKDQALQVILVGQNELRDTLRQPELVQFAQRISVDYHLQPLSAEETANYIRHRISIAGGNPDIFSALACEAVHRYSNGVPRLINLLCDTALVYGYAEQQQQISARLIVQVAREKQAGGIFPTYSPATEDDFPEEEPATVEAIAVAPADIEEATDTTADENETMPAEPASASKTPDPDAEPATPATPVTPLIPGLSSQPENVKRSEGDLYWEQQNERSGKKKVRIGLCAPQEGLRQYLSRLLESYGFDVICALPLDAEHLEKITPAELDILLIDRPDTGTPQPQAVAEQLANWNGPVLYNDSTATEISLKKGNPDFGMVLARRINSLADANMPTSRVVNH
ncbi:MAG: hypothetical protein OEU62_05875, partial [Gammaproteobacteria bacterium]|nr:hypothetical protein [Gammaproteobacteria bacterium]